MINAALVLEGGSLRCMFTSGVLDVFVEQGIEMSYVNGVSAGSMCGLNYIARHVGRNLEINTHYLHDRRYISMRHLKIPNRSSRRLLPAVRPESLNILPKVNAAIFIRQWRLLPVCPCYPAW